MKRWMIKKGGTLILSTATGLGFLSAAALGQDPPTEVNEPQDRAESEPAPPVPAIRSDSQDAAENRVRTEASSVATAPSNQLMIEVKSHHLAESKPQDTQETPSPEKAHPLDEQNAIDEPTFELPVPAETASEGEHSEQDESSTAFTPTFELPSEFAESDRPPKANSQKSPNAGVVIQPAFTSPPSAKPASGKDEANPFGSFRKTASTRPFVHIQPGQTAKPNLPKPFSSAKNRQKVPGLDGCCPVTLRDRRKVIPGRSEHSSRWQGVPYHFASRRAKQTFNANPEKYAPVHAGRDVTLIADSGEEKAGSLEHAVWYQRRLYLFQSQAARQAFSKDPQRYVQ